MKFDQNFRTTIKELDNSDFLKHECPVCCSEKLIIRTSYVREIPDIGNPRERVIVKLKMNTYVCKKCGFTFTPEHPDFPSKHEYSKATIEYALIRYHYHSISGNQIALDLRLLHHLEVPEATVYSWLKLYSPEFLESRINENEESIPPNIKAMTVDGTYVNMGKDIIGKKKDVESLSVTKLKDGRFLLMWWE